MLVVTLIRVFMVMRYKPMAALGDADLPTVTVIIPAFNEGPDVAKSIDSIARSNYPRHKLQIIAIPLSQEAVASAAAGTVAGVVSSVTVGSLSVDVRVR